MIQICRSPHLPRYPLTPHAFVTYQLPQYFLLSPFVFQTLVQSARHLSASPQHQREPLPHSPPTLTNGQLKFCSRRQATTRPQNPPAHSSTITKYFQHKKIPTSSDYATQPPSLPAQHPPPKYIFDTRNTAMLHTKVTKDFGPSSKEPARKRVARACDRCRLKKGKVRTPACCPQVPAQSANIAPLRHKLTMSVV